MKKKYTLKKKGRFIVALTVVLTLTLSVFLASNVYGYKKTSYKVITVNYGDTLWNIASKYSNKQDIRKYIYEIKQINNLNSSSINEGTQIRVPVE